MNGLNRTSLLVGLVVALLALFSSVVLAEESTVDATAIEEAASFDQKYLRPDYIAYSGVEAIPDLEDFDNKSLTAQSVDSQTLRPGYVVHGNAGWVPSVSLDLSALEDFENKSMFTGSDISWVMQQTMTVSNLEDFENKSLTAVSTTSHTPRPSYVAHGNADWVSQSALNLSDLEDFDDKSLVALDDETIATATAFDANYFMPGSIVRTLGPEMTRVHAVRWQAIADYYAQYAMLSAEGDVIASAAAVDTD